MELNDRQGRDAAGIGPYARERESLTALSSLDSWKVSDGDPDIRGWDVRTVSGRQLGCVSDLLIDADAGEVVLLDIDLPGTDRHTFVPIRVVEIDRTRRIILMDSADIPESDLVRTERTPTGESRAADAGVVRYPATDREVIADRAPLADVDPSTERRRADRRRIDRLSTDL